jgi:uncharacterized protein (TIGR00251 family)
LSFRVALKVIPGSSRQCVVGWLGDALKVCVKAPPEQGKANKEVAKVLAAALDISSSQVRVVSGAGSARKVVELEGVSEQQFRQKFPG